MLWSALAAIALLSVGALGWEAWQSARERRRIAAPGILVEIGDVRLHAVLQGRRRGIDQPVLVFDGGLTNGCLAWPAVVAALGPEWLTLSFDRAGHLWSDRAIGARDMEASLADQRALLDALHLAPPWLLVAHSCSGHIARLHAARHPEDVAGLVLVETIPADLAGAITQSSFARSLWWKVPAARLGLWRLRRLQQGLPPRPGQVTPETMQAAWTRLSQSPWGLAATRAELACLVADTEAVDAAPPPQQPCIVLASTRGAVVVPRGLKPAVAHELALLAQRKLAARLPGAALRITAASEHEIPWQAPEEVAQAIRDLAAQLPPGPPTG
ncbi:alpha/beta fold hydrolase [Falsiroseomonas sp.]|uniref:alpha/beta fold hydrolase n=1 Tax=Falsiroseomonas sp. TaxID=2870721 RepID=UPI0027212FCD|nr:alpha/beta hydrolase [Falsiroseomonas sp.]MDO9502736.1 alpha/beta hydrolase [Falsiroseomonas sp.]